MEMGPDYFMFDNKELLVALREELLARAKKQAELVRVKAEYRHWRATEGARLLDADPKMAQWKIDQAIEANPEFMAHKVNEANIVRDIANSEATIHLIDQIIGVRVMEAKNQLPSQ